MSYFIARRLVDVKYISLVNLIMDREIVKELIQRDFNEKNLKKELGRILQPEISNHIKKEYFLLKTNLGEEGASGRAAREIVNYVH